MEKEGYRKVNVGYQEEDIEEAKHNESVSPKGFAGTFKPKTHFGTQFRAIFLKNMILQHRQRKTLACQWCLTIGVLIISALLSLLIPSWSGGDAPLPDPRWIGYDGLFSYWDFNVLVDETGRAGHLTRDGTGDGMLGGIPQSMFSASVETGWIEAYVPFFQDVKDESAINRQFQSSIEKTVADCNDYYVGNCNDSYQIPTAGYVIHQLNQSIGTFEYMLQAGYTPSYPSVKFSQTAQIQMEHINLLDAAFVKSAKTETTWIHTGFRDLTEIFAFKYSTGDMLKYGFQVSTLAFALMLLLPLYMQKIVVERESGILEMNKLMGMNERTYWIANYLYDFIIYFFLLFALVAVGLVCKMKTFLVVSEASIYWGILFVLWGHVQIVIAYFWSCIISKSTRATALGYGLAFLQLLVGIAMNFFAFRIDTEPPWYYMMYPPLAFFRLAYMISHTQATPSIMFRPEMHLHAQLATGFCWLFGMSLVFMLVTWYLQKVIPRQHGVHKNPFFIFTGLYNMIKRKAHSESQSLLMDDKKHAHYEEDEDVRAERQKIYKNQISQDDPLIVKDLTKVYKGNHREEALSKFCLHIEAGDCFGLLGPNGAGKTTLISILSGMVRPTSGSATVGGFDIGEDLAGVQGLIGVCPQFDILWDDLTVVEHLLFYSRLKGLPKYKEAEHVEAIIKQAGLEGERRRLSKDLSGGQKRRLSIAIALTGKPLVVFLDEPTTGLDPSSKRGLWDVILQARVNYSIIISTHSLEEADVLCTRIGIMSKGKLKSVGTQRHLKNKFGKGFKIQLTYDISCKASIEKYIAKILPESILVGDYWGSCTYQIPKDAKLSDIFAEIETNKNRYGIKNWGISQASLEDIFIDIIKKDEESGEMEQIKL